MKGNPFFQLEHTRLLHGDFLNARLLLIQSFYLSGNYNSDQLAAFIESFLAETIILEVRLRLNQN